jgi:predicted small secreted protein
MRRTIAITTLTTALALSLAGCGGQDGREAGAAPSVSSTAPASPTPDVVDQMIEWRDSGGSETLDTFLKDLTAVDKASHPVDLDGLRDACADLAAHVETAQLEDPIPDETANNSWKLTLKHFAASATACSNGAVSDSQDDFDLMASEMDIGIRHMTAVSDRLSELASE